MSLAFLSPCVCEGNYGGVQLSGRLASEALREGAQGFGGVYYRSEDGGATHSGCTGSKFEAALRAARVRRSADTILIWHIDMLKLIPLVRKKMSKVYLFLHGVEAWRKVGGVTPILLDSVDVFLTNSSFTWTRFLENNPQYALRKHVVVPLGTGSIERRLEAPKEHPAGVIIGRIVRDEDYKGHRQLIEAWPSVVREIPRAELWVIGTGNLQEELNRMVISLGVEHNVKFMGRVTDEQRAQLIRDARCLLLPSRGEGFGLVYLEAMRYGRPCLVSNADAGREVVRPPEGGLAVDPDDTHELSLSIVRLLQNGDEWDCWSRRAKALYDSNFTKSHFQLRLRAALSF